jgi:putative phosphoesterase
MTEPAIKIGVISDTHGLLRPEVTDALKGCAHILHAGDIGDIRIISTLEKIAPVTAVRGNIDRRGPCGELPLTQILEFAGHTVYMIHQVATIDLEPSAAGISAVLFGHSHTPTAETERNVLYFNPGSCGPRRFSLPVSVGFLEITKAAIKTKLVTLL